MSQQFNIGVPIHVAASGVVAQPGGEIYTVVCSAAGNLQITAGVASGGTTLLDTIAMTDGMAITLNMRFPIGAYVTITGAYTFVIG